MIKAKFEVNLPVSILKEGKDFIAYSPALDISTVGKTFEEARKRFNEVVEIFFEEILQKGTLDEVLSELGWQKINNTFSPPVVVSHMVEQFSISRLADKYHAPTIAN